MEDECAAWLRAQAEADIKAAGVATDGPWESRGMQVWGATRAYSGGRPGEVLVIGHTWAQEAGHVVRHDPHTEIARAESVLEVIDEYEGQFGYDLEPGVSEGRDDDERTRDEAVKARLGYVVRLLACGYRFRDGYKLEAWKP